MLKKLLLSFFLFLAFPLGNAVAEESSIKIGAIFGMSGGVARYGEWASRGAQIACDQVNATGGIRGRHLDLVIEDNEGQPSKSVTAFQKLKEIDRVEFVLSFLSSVALAVQPLANRAQIVQMDVSATTPQYSSADDYSFRTGATADQVAAAAAQKIFEKFSTHKISCLSIENDFGQGMFDVFQKNYFGVISSVQTFRTGDQDFRAQIMRLRAEKAENVWFVGHLQESGQFLRQAKELGVTPRFFSDTYSIEGQEFLQIAQTAAEGILYFGPNLETKSSNPEVANFIEDYRRRYQEDPNYFAAQSYDGLMSLANAMKSCEKVSASCVKEALYKLSFAGASGKIQFDRNGDVKKEIFLKTVRHGKFELLEKSEARPQ